MAGVELTALDGRFEHLRKPLSRSAAGACRFLGLSPANINIFLVNASGMKRLNLIYRQKNEVTDVIAVESPEEFPRTPADPIGEIYLNPPCARKKHRSLEYALVHGILHLKGFNHLNKNDKIEMEKLEQKVLTWLARTYSA
jgi:probable rRNA maturation factor